MNTILRSYQKQDFLPLKHIIRETWHYDQMCSPKTADKLARVFLTSCLTNYTFSQVAVCQGEVVGIILVKNIQKHKCPPGAKLRQIRSLLSLYLSREGRKMMKIFGSVNGIDQQLLK